MTPPTDHTDTTATPGTGSDGTGLATSADSPGTDSVGTAVSRPSGTPGTGSGGTAVAGSSGAASDGTAVDIAIDVGGTAMKCALVDASGTVRHSERHATNRQRGAGAVVEAIVSVAGELVGTARRLGYEPVGAGLVVPGVVDEAGGIAGYAANIGWQDVPFRTLLAERTGLPTALGHDVRAGAVAEARLGAGAGSDNVFFIAIGTGIAGGHVLGGRTYSGAHGTPSEIGHVQVRHDGPRCGCGRYGCLESLTSAASVGRRYEEAGGGRASAAEVVARAVRGEPRAAAVWAETVDVLADGMVLAARMLDPEVIVVGGGLAEAGEALLAPLAAAIRDRIAFQTAPRLVPAALGDEAGCIGASLLVSDQRNRNSGRSR